MIIIINMGTKKRGLVSHPNYIIGFFFWLCAISTIILFPNLVPKIRFLKKPCVSCKEYSRFFDALTAEQKVEFELLEAGAVNVNGKYYIVGGKSSNEFDLYQKNLIYYQELNPTVDEKLRRIIVLNTLLKSMTPKERDLIQNRKAIIIYRDNSFVLVGVKDVLKSKE